MVRLVDELAQLADAARRVALIATAPRQAARARPASSTTASGPSACEVGAGEEAPRHGDRRPRPPRGRPGCRRARRPRSRRPRAPRRAAPAPRAPAPASGLWRARVLGRDHDVEELAQVRQDAPGEVDRVVALGGHDARGAGRPRAARAAPRSTPVVGQQQRRRCGRGSTPGRRGRARRRAAGEKACHLLHAAAGRRSPPAARPASPRRAPSRTAWRCDSRMRATESITVPSRSSRIGSNPGHALTCTSGGGSSRSASDMRSSVVHAVEVGEVEVQRRDRDLGPLDGGEVRALLALVGRVARRRS